jgi:hypothetical protein
MPATLVSFPRPSLPVAKTIADQHYLLDFTVDHDALMERTARVAGNNMVRSIPDLRAKLGTAADWLRLYQQTLEELEQEIEEASI